MSHPHAHDEVASLRERVHLLESVLDALPFVVFVKDAEERRLQGRLPQAGIDLQRRWPMRQRTRHDGLR